MPLDFRNANTLCTSILIETLARLGLKLAILCPGSRCTPLTVAFATHPSIEALSILDERSAAFFALGHAKQTRRPVAIVCTSGTAAANFYPAIIEAHHTQVPLLVLTGDRPPELRHCHAGQTIDQQKLYGNTPNWYAELALPEPTLAATRYWRQTAIQAWQRCQYPTLGVVHLNSPFRKPLAPIEQSETADLRINPQTFFAHCLPQPPQPAAPLTLPPITATKGIIIAGLAQPDDPEAYCGAIAHLAKSLQYPVLAAGLSPLRNWASLNPLLITQYEQILRDDSNAWCAPELVIQIGELPVSKVLREWLDRLQVPRWIIDPHPENFDPVHGPSRQFVSAIANLSITPPLPQQNQNYLQRWQHEEKSYRMAQEVSFPRITELFEGKVSWLLSRHLPAGTPLMIANSMPARDWAYFAQPGDRHFQIYCSRGASGIDGTLSTALGIAYHNAPTVLLTGDLAFLHDTNGLLSCSKLQGHLTIIVINNNGGGIFEMLPIAQFEPPFEEFFATPQQVELSSLCAAYGVEYVAIASWEQFTPLVSSLPEQGVRVLELKSDRRADQQQRRSLLG